MATLARIRIVGAVKERVEAVVKAVTLNVVANLRRAPSDGGTPVDTGWARANWIPQVGGPRNATAGNRSAVSTAEQDAGVAAIAAGYKLEQGDVSISNHVPYIGQLNDGFSPQAAAGFVERAVLEAVEQVRAS